MKHLYLILLLACALGVNAQQQVLEGDLLFAYSSTTGRAISDATVHDSTALPIYHVAIATWIGDRLYALEAIDEGVVLTPYDKFQERTKNKGGMLIGRLHDRSGVDQSVSNAMEHLGKPYDDLYMIDTQEIYCSELVQLSYVNGKGQRLFPLINMSFHNAQGRILDYWREHYAKRGMAVPEGALGTNPAQIANDPAVEIIKQQ
ncbi:MAG: hypothetical protein IJK68_07620 [Muribaculaceae bacterium]|nr:hypothetical protein [Muribaculaceae bacterium]MBR0023348.1 hypothetical protein [Muribaculaceae bacterium]